MYNIIVVYIFCGGFTMRTVIVSFENQRIKEHHLEKCLVTDNLKTSFHKVDTLGLYKKIPKKV